MKKFQLEESNYSLKPVKFDCDNILGDHIKEPFPDKSFFLMIVGKAGSGKTSLLINMINEKGSNRIYKNCFDKILLVMPKNSRSSIKDNIFDDLPEDQTFEEFTYDVIDKVKETREEFDTLEIEDKNKKRKKKNRNQLLILDDITATLKNITIQKSLVELCTNRRHYKLSIILLVQYLRAVPRPVRFQVTDLIFFKPSNRIDAKIIEEEYINLKKDDYDDLTRFVWQTSHDFLFVKKSDESYYKNLNKIILT